MRWRRRAREAPRAGAAPPAHDLERAVRLLAVRSRRDVSSVFAGAYQSAFRGGGVEFEESRPYVPGDDVRSIDWNALARTGQPFVKRFREERDQTVLLALDVSDSMRFGTRGRAKAALAAHAGALLAAAAARSGDRVGLVSFDARVREAIAPARGEAQLWRVLRALVKAAEAPSGGTSLAAALSGVHALTRRHAVVVVLSDFRDPGFFSEPSAGGGERVELLALARRCDVVACVLHDPREDALPPVGSVRVADPERPGASLVLRAGSARVRERYAEAAAARRRALERQLRGAGADVLWLPTGSEPLPVLAGFFRRHHGSRLGSVA